MYDPMTGTMRNTRDVIWAEWKRTDPKETMKIFEEHKDMGSETTVGVDEPIKYNKEQQEDPNYADHDDNELPDDPTNNIATAGRNAANNIAGRNAADAVIDIAGRMTNATTTMVNQGMTRKVTTLFIVG